MRERRIGLLAVQETHLDQNFVDHVHYMYGRRMVLHNSFHPTATNSNGVSIVLNKDLVDTDSAETVELVPGRAIATSFRWHADRRLTVLAVYAPNDQTENAAFWASLEDALSAGTAPRPDIMLGDFNIVEDPLDRAPQRADSTAATSALQRLTNGLNLDDGWRVRNPGTTAFTFPRVPAPSGPTRMSRLDRIYVTPQLLDTAHSWNLDTDLGTVVTDHKLVTVSVVDAQTPHVGSGRWTMPLHALQDKKTLEAIEALGLRLQKNLDRLADAPVPGAPPSTRQSLYAAFKTDLVALIRHRCRITAPTMERNIALLQQRIDALLICPADDGTGPPDASRLEAALLQERVLQLQTKRYATAKVSAQARHRLYGETLSKYWSATGKDRKPRDIVYALHMPGRPQTTETRSDRMAELTRNYHDGLQDAPIDPPVPDDYRAVKIEEAIASITVQPREEHRTALGARYSEDMVRHTIRVAPGGKASGIDGIPYELWRTLDDRYVRRREAGEEAFNISLVLAELYNDISDHGLEHGSHFAKGWLCPLYKSKGELRDVSNYRPITLLNTDYKLLSKILALRLVQVAPYLIHRDQAGFVPGRHIADQTMTATLMMDYAEATEENGIIVALDQEKAYDRVAHDYLWAVLDAYDLPASFVSMVRHLYANAYTVVILNGEVSTPFQVTRGVRQGDPMSCLLFNLAIEPLANLIRSSRLRGYEIPGVADRLLVKLFADDTTVYLSEDDDFEELQDILDAWCVASTARFNVAKTEIIPMGSPEYRLAVCETKRIRHDAGPFPPSITRISRDGHAVRILGAWIGNRVDQAAQWSRVVNLVRGDLERWGATHPTYRGKKLICQMVVGGRTQYLAKVQGMPVAVTKQLSTLQRQFVWGESQPLVNAETSSTLR